MPDQFIDLKRAQDEAAICRAKLDSGELSDEDAAAMYAAYNALLFVLDYSVKPPSELWK